jgi:hypothetical protein
MDCLADSARVHLGLFDTEEASWYQYLSILISSAGHRVTDSNPHSSVWY